MSNKTTMKDVLNTIMKNLWVLVPLFCLITIVKCYSIYMNDKNKMLNS